MKRLILPLALLLLALAAAVGYLYATQDAQIFPRTVGKVEAPDPALSPFDHLGLKTPDGTTLRGVLFPAGQPSPTLILAFAGNAHDAVGFAGFLKNAVAPEGAVAVAAFSYRGYPNVLGSQSGGTPSEENLTQDALFIHDTFTQRLKPARTYAVGYSLGSAVAAKLATQRPLNGIVLIAPPASIRRLAQEKYPYLPASLLVKHPFATEDILGAVTTSTTLIHTPTDGLIPPQHVEILHAAQPAAQVVELTGATHGNILDHSAMPRLLRMVLNLPAQPLQPE